MQTPTKTTIPTDLITPLAAYLRLRAVAFGGASFLLESVDQGRLGRFSFVGCGRRVVSFDEAGALGEAGVGSLGYDVVTRLEPTVPLPEDGPGFPESRFVVPEMLVRFDHVLGAADVLPGDPPELRALLDAPAPPLPQSRFARGPLRRFPDQAEHERRILKA